MHHLKIIKTTRRLTILLILGCSTHGLIFAQQTTASASKVAATHAAGQPKETTASTGSEEQDLIGVLFRQAIVEKTEASQQAENPVKKMLLDEKFVDIDHLIEGGLETIAQEIYKPNPNQLAIRAKKELLQGDLDAASRLLKQLAAQQGSASLEQLQKAAKLAKQDGALWIERDSQQTIASFELALSYQNDDLFVLDTLIKLYKSVGRNDLALKHARTLVFFAENLVDPALKNTGPICIATGLNILAEILEAQGQKEQALAYYKKSLAIVEKNAPISPGGLWQRNLSIGLEKVKGVLPAQEPMKRSRTQPPKNATISERYAIKKADIYKNIYIDRANGEWLIVQGTSIGNLITLTKSKGDLEKALNYSKINLVAFEKLAASNPANDLRQRDVSTNLDNVADILQKQGQLDQSFTLYQKSLAIRQNLASKDPKSNAWQANLVASYIQLANLRPDTVSTDMARKYLISALTISQKLATAGELSPEQRSWPTYLQGRLNELRLETDPSQRHHARPPVL